MQNILSKIFPVILFIASIALLGFTFLHFNSDMDLDATPVASAQTDWVRGNTDAPVTIYEYTDYQCPYCKMAEPAIQELLAKYPDQVRVVLRHFPIESIHDQAMLAAHAAEAAGEQGKFWEMHDLLFENQEALSSSTIDGLAQSLDLDMKAFREQIKSQAIRDKIVAQQAEGEEMGVNSTPTFFINGEKLVGAQEVADFEAYLQ